jgi:hypothetical protein
MGTELNSITPPHTRPFACVIPSRDGIETLV